MKPEARQPNLGRDLYQILPAVYRTRDAGDLEAFFNVCGALLNQVQGTLTQRFADHFPDRPEGGSAHLAQGLSCQDWLLPYFADLLDARLLSPLPNGQRDEIAHAISWRQRKGTLAVIEQVAEAITQNDFVIQEGWKRVATTARIGKPLLSARSFGYEEEPPLSAASLMARHPALPTTMIDMRCPSGAVKTDEQNPGTQRAKIDTQARLWRQASQHGVPCNPGSYDDVSRRTVDVRCPDWRHGHFHPRRVLLFSPPPAGFFSNTVDSVLWTSREDPESRFHELIEISEDDGVMTYRNRTWGTDDFQPVKIRRVVELDTVDEDQSLRWRFQGIIFENTVLVHHGRLELSDCAARKIELHTIDTVEPVLIAEHCLIGEILAARGLCRLIYCTILGHMVIEVPQASDCIFLTRIDRDHGGETPPQRGCIRFSRIIPEQKFDGARSHANTNDTPLFFSSQYGEYGCAVLHPESPVSICEGAEDGGEMGAFHDAYHCRLRAALLEKLDDFLPIGMEAALIPDSTLLATPLAPLPA